MKNNKTINALFRQITSLTLVCAGSQAMAYDAAFNSGFDAHANAWAAPGWEIQRVSSGVGYVYNDVKDAGAVAIDANNNRHVVYADPSNAGTITQLKFYYGFSSGGTWNEEVILALTPQELAEFSGSSATDMDIAIDSLGRVHVVLGYRTAGFVWVLRYAVRENGQWQSSFIPEAENASFPSIAVDSQNNAHVVYEIAQATYRNLYDGSSWVREHVGNQARFPDIAIGTDDIPQIALRRSGGISVASPSTVTAGVWVVAKAFRQTDYGITSGWYPAIALDSQNYPHVSYAGIANDNFSNADLGYSFFDGSGWQNFLDIGEIYSTGYSAIALDSNDLPHIAHEVLFGYPSPSNSTAMDYSFFDGLQWQSQRVNNGTSIQQVSLALDSSDQPAIFYKSTDLVASGQGWTNLESRPFYAPFDLPWGGIALASPRLTPDPFAEDEAYVLVSGDNSHFSQYYLNFDDNGVFHSRYPEDLDTITAELISGGGPQALGDYRNTNATTDIDVGGSVAIVGDFNSDGLSDYIALGVNAENDVVVEYHAKQVGSKNFFTSVIEGETTVETLSGLLTDYIDGAAADVNGDGYLDFVFSDTALPGLQLYLGDGDGSFQTATGISTLIIPHGVDSEDIDSDGNADFVVSSDDGSGEVEILVGVGDGTFNHSVAVLSTQSASAAAAGISLGDFDFDQLVDLAVTNFTDGVAVYSGNGDGTFNPTPTVSAVNLGAASNVGRMVDNTYLNQDAYLDLVVSNPASQGVSVLYGNGEGSFTVLDQQFAHYLNPSIICNKDISEITNGNYSACLQDPAMVGHRDYLSWELGAPKGVSTQPYFVLQAPVVPHAPIADAGEDQLVIQLGSNVVLDGSQSWDEDGDTITYSWTINSLPLGTTAKLNDSTVVNPSFIADVQGSYVVSLVVSDGLFASETDFVEISFFNIAPIPEAGSNQSVVQGDFVSVDGSASSDANGDPLTFAWTLSQIPSNSTASLSSQNFVYTDFIADMAGTYELSLIVNDGIVDSEESVITVVAVSLESLVITSLNQAIDAINNLDGNDFKNKNMPKTLTKKVTEVISKVDEGDFQQAYNKLTNDTMGKTDGCAEEGDVDKNDWIINCSAQANVYLTLLDAKTALAQLLN